MYLQTRVARVADHGAMIQEISPGYKKEGKKEFTEKGKRIQKSVNRENQYQMLHETQIKHLQLGLWQIQ